MPGIRPNARHASNAANWRVYLPRGGKTTVKLGEGRFRVSRYNPRNGEGETLPIVEGPTWTSPEMPDAGAWALLLASEK